MARVQELAIFIGHYRGDGSDEAIDFEIFYEIIEWDYTSWAVDIGCEGIWTSYLKVQSVGSILNWIVEAVELCLCVRCIYAL